MLDCLGAKSLDDAFEFDEYYMALLKVSKNYSKKDRLTIRDDIRILRKLKKKFENSSFSKRQLKAKLDLSDEDIARIDCVEKYGEKRYLKGSVHDFLSGTQY